MNSVYTLQESFLTYLMHTFDLTKEQAYSCKLNVNAEPSRQQFGDLSTSAPMHLAKIMRQPPALIATRIIQEFNHPLIASATLAGPGFLNFFLTPLAFEIIAKELYVAKEKFFKVTSASRPPKEKVNIEFISVNPTGPLHFGHGRGGIIGDVIANVVSFLGSQVTKEFYINDVGKQMKRLATSLLIRCQQLMGIQSQLPEDGYQGEYLQELARKCIAESPTPVLEKSEQFFQDYAKEHMLKNIKSTLNAYGITFDVWFSEQKLHQDASITNVIEMMTRKNLIYEQDGALWFASTKFHDDKDRVVRKASGELTYVAADIAYLKNKVDRGFNRIIMVLGHDHHSYATRLHALKEALDITIPLDIILYQLVKIKEGDAEVRMSKRAGTMITLTDVIDTVGVDVARFFYLHRKCDAQLEFDLDLAVKKTEDNPVYSIQYAYVRAKSILAKASTIPSLSAITQEDAAYIGKQEELLLKKMVLLVDLLPTIADTYHTHILTYYTLELTHIFHAYYSQNRVVDLTAVSQSRARLLLVTLFKNTITMLLDLMGISKPDAM